MLWAAMAVLFSSFECVERCNESLPPPFIEAHFIFEDANNVNLLTSNQLTIASIEIKNTVTNELLTFEAFNNGIIVNFPEGSHNFSLTTPLKEFEFAVDVDSFQGECNRIYKLTSFSIDGRSITFTQPVFTFRF